MKINFSKIMGTSLKGVLILIGGYALNSSCKKSDNNNSNPTSSSYQQVNLVADATGWTGSRIDPILKNAWGIAIGPTGAFWISANHTGSTVIYDNNGVQLKTPISIPLGIVPNGASPTGVVYNSTSHFSIPLMGKSLFIYATEDGILSAWNSNTGSSTVTVADRSGSNAVYKGITLASNGDLNYIYATDFHNAKVDVFDTSFNYVTSMPFNDPNIPSGFAPFNIQNINNQLYVSYAKQKPDKMDDTSGVGNGYIDIFSTAGVLIKRFASQGTLNSPWGITQAPASFGAGTGAVLVGNFGDGKINIFDASGNYQGQLKNNGNVITVLGLWAITFDNISPADPNLLYFTAGPHDESDGVFGYLKKM